jgi:repressor LexA
MLVIIRNFRKEAFEPMQGVGETIRRLREEAGLSQRALARKAGLSSQYLSDIEVGRTSPSLKSLEKLAGALQIAPGRLLQGQDQFSSQVVQVPVLGRVPAGGPVVSEEVILGYLPLPRKLASEDTFCLEVRGESMQDLGIDSGDYVLVRVQPTAENGQVVIARVEGEVTCKRYYHTGRMISLEPANRRFHPLRLEAGEIEIVGVVTNVIKRV